MTGFSDDCTPTLLEQLGFTQVSPVNSGVYHLKSNPVGETAPVEYIALLYSPTPITPETRSVQLFVQTIPTLLPINVSPLRIQTHWQNLDARRLEASGLEAITVAVRANEQWKSLPTVEYARPADEWRIRHCVQLPTGDVVCYN